MSAVPPPPPPPPPPPHFPPPPPGPPIQIPAGELRPRRLWYFVAGLVLALAIAGAVVIFASGEDSDALGAITGDHTEFLAPGEATVEAEAGEELAIYRQVPRRADSFEEDPRVAGALECEVTSLPGGAPVAVDRDLGFTTLDLGGAHYVTTFGFDARGAGSYRVTCDTGSVRGLAVPLLIGERLEVGEVFGLIGTVLAGIAAIVLGIMIAVGIVLPVAIARSRHKRRLQAEAAAAGLG